jgi:hypothetical protein
LVEALKLNDFDNEELKEQKKSLLEEIKSFENTEDALDYFRTLVTDTFNRIDGYFKPEDVEKAEAVPSKEDESKNDEKIDFSKFGARPHAVKVYHRKGQRHHKARPHHDKDFLNAVAHRVHHDEAFFKNHGYKPHGVRPHGVRPHHGARTKGCSGKGETSAKSWTDSFNDAINYVKSYGQKPEEVEDSKSFAVNSGDDVPSPHYRHRKYHKGDSRKHASEDAENCGVFAGFIGVLGLALVGGAVAKRVRNKRRAAKALKLEDDEEALPHYESEEESDEVSNEKN